MDRSGGRIRDELLHRFSHLQPLGRSVHTGIVVFDAHALLADSGSGASGERPPVRIPGRRFVYVSLRTLVTVRFVVLGNTGSLLFLALTQLGRKEQGAYSPAPFDQGIPLFAGRFGA